MTRRTPVFAVLSLLWCVSAGAATRYAASLAAATEESRKTGRPMLIVLETSWCGWCKKLERDTLSDPRLTARSETDLIFVKLNAEDGGAGAKLARANGVRSYPTMLLADADQKVLGRLSGYRAPEALLRDLEGALGSHREIAAALEREKKAPKDPAALLAAAQALERAGRDAEALRRWETLAALPDSKPAAREQALWRIVAIAAKTGDRSRKIEALGRIVHDHGASARLEEALFELGTTHAQMGDKDDAVSAFQRLLKSFPKGRYAPAAQGELTRLGVDAQARTAG